MSLADGPFAEIIADEATLAAAVSRLADAVHRDTSPGASLLVVAILEGARRFATDLCALLTERGATVELAFIRASSYGRELESSGVVTILADLATDPNDRHVLVVDDIVDRGHTLAEISARLLRANPASLRLCALLNKPTGRTREVRVDYVGLTVPDAFIVGYGLDYQENYRNLPYLATLDLKALEHR